MKRRLSTLVAVTFGQKFFRKSRPAKSPRIASDLELLESRIAPATLYVGHASDYSIVTDHGVIGVVDTGDVVTWNPGAGSHLSTPGHNLTIGTDAFLSISSAITAASSGDTIAVSTGIFSENVTINKPLTLLGANSGVAGSDGVHRPAETSIQTVGNQNAVVTISSSNVTIDGFTINGDDPSVTGAPTASGDDANVLYGVRPTAGFSNLTMENNIVKHAAIGFRGDGTASSNLITQNWFDDIGNYDFGYAVSLRTNFYADVTNNLMTRVWTGVHTNNFFQAGPATWSVSGNTIHSYAGGIWDNLQYQAARSLTIDSNQISAETGAVAGNIGILLITIQDTVTANITHNTITGTDYGVLAWNTSTSNAPVLDSTDTITGTKIAGVNFVDNLASTPIGTTVFGTAAASHLTLNGVGITAASGTGVILDATAGSPTATTLTISGSTAISGGATGLKVTGSLAAITGNTLNSTVFTGQSSQYIQLTSNALGGATIDATGVTFDGLTGATATPAQNFAIEAKITDRLDNSSLGYVQIKAGTVFISPGGMIQPAINAANPGDIIYVLGGSYPEAVNVNKAVTLSLLGGISINSLTGIPTADTDLNSSTLTVGDATNTSYQGLVEGTGGLTKVGVGTLALSGTNTYSGVTNINAGSIDAQSNSALGVTGSSSGTVVASGAQLELEGGVTLGETISAAGTGPGGLGAIHSLSGSNHLTGPITLTGATTIVVDALASLIFHGAVDGTVALTLDIGALGVAGFSGGIGSTHPLNSFTASGAGALHLAGAVDVTGNTTNINTPLVLTGDTSISDLGAINFNTGATVDGDGSGPWALTLSTLNTVSFAEDVGGSEPLAALTISAVNVTANGAINADSLTVSGVTGAATFNGPIELTGSDTNFSVTANQLFVENTVDANGGDIVWTVDHIDISADVSSSNGSLTIQPMTTGRTIALNSGTGSLVISSTDIGHLQDGFAGIQSGSVTTGAINVGPITFTDPVTILAPSSAVTVAGVISGTDDASVTIHAAQIQLSESIPAAVIDTGSGDIDLNGSVVLLDDTLLHTTGGDVTIDGLINGHNDFVIDAGTGTVNLNSSHLQVSASTGGSVPLNSIDVSGGVLNIQPLAVTTGSQSYTASSAINLHAGGMTVTGTGDVTFNGPVIVRNEIRIITKDGNVDFNGTVDNDAITTGNGALNITAPNSDITFHDDVGFSDPLIRIVVGSADQVTADGQLSVLHDLSLTTDGVSFSPLADSVHGSGVLTLQPVEDSIPIHVGGGFHGGTLNLTTANLAALADGFGLIDIGRTNGKAAITVDSGGASFSDPVVFRQVATSGIVSVSGPLTGTDDASFTFSAGTTSLSGNITTDGGFVTMSKVSVGQGVAISTSGGAINITGQVTDAGGHDSLTLNADGGSITLASGIGKSQTPQFGAITLDSTGTTTIGKAVVADSFTTGTGGTLVLHGSITTTAAGGQHFNEPVQLSASTTLTSSGAPVHFADTVDSISGKAYSLTVKGGSGMIMLDDDLGFGTSLASVTLKTTGSVTAAGIIKGSALTVSAAHFTVHDVDTTGAQSYTGIGTYSGALTGKTLKISSTAAVTNTATWDFTGAASVKVGAHNITLTSGSNSFGSLALSGATAAVSEFGSALLGNISLTGNLTVTAGDDISQIGTMTVMGLTLTAGGLIDLSGGKNTVHTLNAISAQDGITILSGSANLTIMSTLTTANGDITLASDMRKTRNNILDHAGGSALTTPNGRFVLFTYSEVHSYLPDLPIEYSERLGHRYPYALPVASNGLNTVVYVVH